MGPLSSRHATWNEQIFGVNEQIPERGQTTNRHRALNRHGSNEQMFGKKEQVPDGGQSD